jgi:hypothetical protein
LAKLLDIVNGYNWDGSADAVEAILREFYPELLGIAYDEAGAQLPVDIEFDVTNERVVEVIDELASRIRGVAETTRDDVRRWVETGTKEGLSIQQIAEQIRSQASGISKSRSVTIARTETGTALNLGATLAYEEAGVEEVEVLDGDDDEPCASVNGTTQTLKWARENPLGHPNCQRAFAPVVK